MNNNKINQNILFENRSIVSNLLMRKMKNAIVNICARLPKKYRNLEKVLY